jgi:hypothetical protein
MQSKSSAVYLVVFFSERAQIAKSMRNVSRLGRLFIIKFSVDHSGADPGCLSRIRIFYIPDPGYKVKNISGSRICIRIKEFRSLTQKIVSKLSEIDPECSSRIRILIFTHPGSRGQKGIGSRIRIRNKSLVDRHYLTAPLVPPLLTNTCRYAYQYHQYCGCRSGSDYLSRMMPIQIQIYPKF